MTEMDMHTSYMLRVDFLNIDDVICTNSDFVCKYIFKDYRPSLGDRIVLYKSGWKHIEDFCLSEWVPTDDKQYVTFCRSKLPNNTNCFYQLCYVSLRSQILGTSKLFQFSNTAQMNTTNYIFDKCIESKRIEMLKKTIEELELENHKLKQMLKLKLSDMDYDKEIGSLKLVIKSLQEVVQKQGADIEILKKQGLQGENNGKSLYEDSVKLLENKVSISRQENGRAGVASILDGWDLESIPPFPL